MWRRLVSLLRPDESPYRVAERLRRAGLEDAVDVAVAEYFLFHDEANPVALGEWIRDWPWMPGLGKARAVDPGARVGRLAGRGVLRSTGPDRWRLSARVLELFPAYPVATEAGDEAGPSYAIDFFQARREVFLPDDGGDDGDDPASICERALTTLAARVQGEPVPESEGALLAAELGDMPKLELRLAAALCRTAAEDPGSHMSAALVAATERLRNRLAPASESPDEPLSALSALRVLVLRFAANMGADFKPEWLAERRTQRNQRRRSQFLRSWALYAGLGIRVDGREETPTERAVRLLEVDARRERLFAEEASHQKKVAKAAETRIEAERKAREERAKAYASGRRE